MSHKNWSCIEKFYPFTEGWTEIDSIKTYDFSTLYTTIPHNKLKSRLFQIIDNCFLNKNGTRKYKFLVIGKQDTYFVRHHSDSPYKYSEADIKSMLGFLVDNIYVVFGDQVFQQSVGIPMGGARVAQWLERRAQRSDDP